MSGTAIVAVAAAAAIVSLLGAVISGGITAQYAFTQNYGHGLNAASFFTILFIVIAMIALLVLTFKALSVTHRLFSIYQKAPLTTVSALWAQLQNTPTPATAAQVPVAAAPTTPTEAQ